MAKPMRSPLLGYNHNVRYRGRIFHVQTEDSGPANPHLFTHLYFEGTILASKKHEYDRESSEETVRALMQSQHKAILKDLKSGVYDDRVGRFFAARGEALDAQVAAPVQENRALDLDAVPMTPPPVVTGPAPEAQILDDRTTDPHVTTDPHLTPPLQPLPPPLPPDLPLPTRPSTAGPGVYAMKGAQRETPFERPPSPPAGGGQPVRSLTPPVVVLPPPGARRRPVKPPTNPGAAPVVVQRTVVVGTNPPPSAGQPMVPPGPRPRRPAQAIPYVVKEGSHPLAQPQRPVHTAGVVPPRPLTPPPVSAPRTTGVAGKTPSPEPLVEKSLDEVILAYLAQGGEGDPR